MSGGWTTERIETLKTLHAEGKSMTEIALALGLGKEGRGAVTGKIHRLHLQKGKEAALARQRLSGVRNARLAKPPVPASEETAPGVSPIPNLVERSLSAARPVAGSRAVPLSQLGPDDCRWPLVGLMDPVDANTLWCGAPGGRFCPIHAGRALIAPTPRAPQTAKDLIRSVRRCV